MHFFPVKSFCYLGLLSFLLHVALERAIQHFCLSVRSAVAFMHTCCYSWNRFAPIEILSENCGVPWEIRTNQKMKTFDVRTFNLCTARATSNSGGSVVYWLCSWTCKLQLDGFEHSLANRDSCPTPAKSEGIEYLQSWIHSRYWCVQVQVRVPYLFYF